MPLVALFEEQVHQMHLQMVSQQTQVGAHFCLRVAKMRLLLSH